jgi:hypothetical protein
MDKPGSAPARVRVIRSGDSVTVDPFRLHVARDQEVEWVLEGSDDEMTVTGKPNEPPWPFEGGPPRGGKGGPARTGRMRGEAEGGTYRYNIELDAGGGDPLIIDPEMILPPRIK